MVSLRVRYKNTFTIVWCFIHLMHSQPWLHIASMSHPPCGESTLKGSRADTCLPSFPARCTLEQASPPLQASLTTVGPPECGRSKREGKMWMSLISCWYVQGFTTRSSLQMSWTFLASPPPTLMDTNVMSMSSGADPPMPFWSRL